MPTPTVSFIVPCYKLAHLLPECINSILAQTYGDFEVLIMDDCSPDNTPEVARSFGDPRVRHVRNDPNLGHLRNYNKGIGLARGNYVWLISADDYLRRPYVLQKYVVLLDKHPSVGYAYCSGVGVQNGKETEILAYSVYANSDRIVRGHDFLRSLVKGNLVLSAAGMVRRECYEKLGCFPLNMPFAGDWYLWSLFALHYDVAYFAEPMVSYRQHDLSMTSGFIEKGAEVCCQDDVAVPWAIKNRADEAGLSHISRDCLSALGEIYARNIATRRYGMVGPSFSLEQFEHSLVRNTASEGERDLLRSRTYAGIGNEYYWQGERVLAREFYGRALKIDPWLMAVRVKKLLLYLGRPGDRLRKTIWSYRSVGGSSKVARRNGKPS